MLGADVRRERQDREGTDADEHRRVACDVPRAAEDADRARGDDGGRSSRPTRRTSPVPLYRVARTEWPDGTLGGERLRVRNRAPVQAQNTAAATRTITLAITNARIRGAIVPATASSPPTSAIAIGGTAAY